MLVSASSVARAPMALPPTWPTSLVAKRGSVIARVSTSVPDGLNVSELKRSLVGPLRVVEWDQEHADVIIEMTGDVVVLAVRNPISLGCGSWASNRSHNASAVASEGRASEPQGLPLVAFQAQSQVAR